MSDAEVQAQTQYLTFRLGEETFAVDVTKAREVLDYVPPTRVPQTSKFMLGVINLRGSVVPVIDMRQKLGLAPAERTRDTCIVVLEIALDGETIVVGALADSVREVLELGAEQIEPPPRIGTKLNADLIRGMGKREEEFLILLNIDRVFSTDEIALVQGVQGEMATA